MLIYCLGGNALKNDYFLRIGKGHLNEIIAKNRLIFFSLFYASLILM